jgi:hypothetical protein
MENEMNIESIVTNEILKRNEFIKNTKKKNLKASVCHPTHLSQSEQNIMYQLFLKYYEGHPFDVFQRDLLEKDDVILLKDTETQKIQGFSTILKVKIKRGEKIYNAIYSGDTVLSTDYWGTSALGIKFLKYLWWEKMKNPFKPLNWFLISKGYKTYLLMANNFHTHYPRYEKATTPHHQELMKSFYSARFIDTYNSESHLIKPHGVTCHLKENIADISEKLLENPRIKFFQEKNPKWKEGHELCCIAEMTIFMPLKYALKKFFKGLLK